jgi:hypothetical protein
MSKKYDCDFEPVSTIMTTKLITVQEDTHWTELANIVSLKNKI